MRDFRFSCPHCQLHIEAEVRYVNQQIDCPGCGRTLVVPHPGRTTTFGLAFRSASGLTSRHIPGSGLTSRQIPITQPVALVPEEPVETVEPEKSVLPLLALVLSPLGAPGVILGHIALGWLKKNPESNGKGMAATGLVIGYLSLVLILGSTVVIANKRPGTKLSTNQPAPTAAIPAAIPQDSDQPVGPKAKPTSENPAVAANSDGRLEVFGIHAGGSVAHIWQIAANGAFSGWATLPSDSVSSRVAVVGGLPGGCLEAFCLSKNAVLYCRQTAGVNGGWSSWESLGGNFTDLAAMNEIDGSVEVFALRPDGLASHIFQHTNGVWSSWSLFGGNSIRGITRIAVGRNGYHSQYLEAFCIASNTLYHCWQNPTWYAWDSLGGNVTDLFVANTTDGRIEIFGICADGTANHIRQNPNPPGGWSNWMPLGGTDVSGITRIVAGLNSGGKLEAFCIAGDKLYHSRQTPKSCNWTSLGGPITSLSVGANQDGKLQLFGRQPDGAMRCCSESSGWKWTDLGGNFQP